MIARLREYLSAGARVPYWIAGGLFIPIGLANLMARFS